MIRINNYNNNRFPGPRGWGVEKERSSNQRRYTRGREKRIHSTLMLWEINQTQVRYCRVAEELKTLSIFKVFSDMYPTITFFLCHTFSPD